MFYEKFFNHLLKFLKKSVPYLKKDIAFSKYHPWLSSFLHVFVFVLICILLIDKPLTLFLKSNLEMYTFGFFMTLKKFTSPEILYTFVVLAYIGHLITSGTALTSERFERLHHGANATFFVFFSMLSSTLVISVLKFVIGRYRTSHLFTDHLYGFSPLTFDFAGSFPASHAQAVWAFFLSLCLVFPAYRIICIAMATLISLSHLMTADSFLSDVIIGSYIGIVCTLLVYFYRQKSG